MITLHAGNVGFADDCRRVVAEVVGQEFELAAAAKAHAAIEARTTVGKTLLTVPR